MTSEPKKGVTGTSDGGPVGQALQPAGASQPAIGPGPGSCPGAPRGPPLWSEWSRSVDPHRRRRTTDGGQDPVVGAQNHLSQVPRDEKAQPSLMVTELISKQSCDVFVPFHQTRKLRLRGVEYTSPLTSSSVSKAGLEPLAPGLHPNCFL